MIQRDIAEVREVFEGNLENIMSEMETMAEKVK
jgi:hypothetical protein